MIKIAIIFNADRLSGRLTRFWTGCTAYHAAFVDEASGKMYDMHLIRRRRPWPYYTEGEVLLFDAPACITAAYLERQLDVDTATYGWQDYLLFALRPLYHLFGKSTRNAGGVICSEMVNNDIRACGGVTPWATSDAPPSPCDLFGWLRQ